MFHGTFRSDESLRDAPTIHAGSHEAAEYRLNHVSRSMGVRPDVESTPTTPGHLSNLSTQMMGVEERTRKFMGRRATSREVMSQPDILSRIGKGRIIPRRYDRVGNDEYPGVLRDPHANHMDAVYLQSLGKDVSGSVSDSYSEPESDEEYDWSDYEDDPAIDALWAGKRLPYKNTIEGSGDDSYVVPKWPETTKGYWDDVEDSPNTTAAQKEMARIMRAGGETTVPFKADHAPSDQGALFTSSGSTLFGERVDKWTTHPEGIFGRENHDVEATHFSRPDPEWEAEKPNSGGWAKAEEKPDLSKVKLVANGEPKPAF
jgi:hypothetical protein